MFWAGAFTLGDFTLHPVRTEATHRRETVLCLHQPRRFQPGFVTSAPVVLTGPGVCKVHEAGSQMVAFPSAFGWGY